MRPCPGCDECRVLFPVDDGQLCIDCRPGPGEGRDKKAPPANVELSAKKTVVSHRNSSDGLGNWRL
jgi:hypothetical protein